METSQLKKNAQDISSRINATYDINMQGIGTGISQFN